MKAAYLRQINHIVTLLEDIDGVTVYSIDINEKSTSYIVVVIHGTIANVLPSLSTFPYRVLGFSGNMSMLELNLRLEKSTA